MGTERTQRPCVLVSSALKGPKRLVDAVGVVERLSAPGGRLSSGVDESECRGGVREGQYGSPPLYDRNTITKCQNETVYYTINHVIKATQC